MILIQYEAQKGGSDVKNFFMIVLGIKIYLVHRHTNLVYKE